MFAGTAVAAIAMTTMTTTRTTIAMTTVTTRTRTTGTRAVAALLLLIAFRLGEQGAMRQTQLAGLLVDFDELHIDFITFLQASLFHALITLPVDFRNVEQTVLTMAVVTAMAVMVVATVTVVATAMATMAAMAVVPADINSTRSSGGFPNPPALP